MQSVLTKIKGAFAPVLLMMTLSTSGVAVDSFTPKMTGKIGLNATKAVCCSRGCEDITFGLMGALGYEFHQYFGIEGRLTKTVWEYEQQKVKQHIAIFAKPTYPITNELNLYGLIGYGQAQTGEKIKSNDSGIAWGAGVHYYFDNTSIKRVGIFFDYERMIQKSNAPDLDSINTGISYQF